MATRERSLGDILKDLVDTKATADVCIDEIPWSTRTAWQTNINQAKDLLKTLKAEYADRLLPATLGIAVMGESELTAKFASVAAAEGDTITLDASELYARLAVNVDRAIGAERSFTTSMMPILLRSVKEVADELGIREIAAPQMGSIHVLPTLPDVIGYVRTLIRGACGDDLNRQYLANTLVNIAVTNGVKGAVVPVVVIGATPSEVVGLAGMFGTMGAQVSVKSEEDCSPENVIKAFKQAKQKNKTAKAVEAAKVEN